MYTYERFFSSLSAAGPHVHDAGRACVGAAVLQPHHDGRAGRSVQGHAAGVCSGEGHAKRTQKQTKTRNQTNNNNQIKIKKIEQHAPLFR